MKRRAFFAALAGASAAPAADDACPVRVDVGTGPSVAISVPGVPKEAMADIVATFLGRDKAGPTSELRRLFDTAKQITLTITTRCERRSVRQ